MAEAVTSAVVSCTETIGLPPAPRLNDERTPSLPDYRLIKNIGCGAFGSVWLAEEPLAGLFRAIKVLDGGGRSRKAHAELTNRELAGLHTYQTRAHGHPNLIQVFKTGVCSLSRPSSDRTTSGSHDVTANRTKPPPPAAAVYYVMEIADHAGGAQPHQPGDYRPLTLASVIRQMGRLPLQLSIENARALLAAIEYLHGAGIHHRDIKPSNILFVGGALKLADIGLISDELDERVGTNGYLPPEGKPSDLYAFGKVLYEMVTGLPAAAFPEWPGDLVPNDDVRLTTVRALLNRLCHPSLGKRLPRIDVVRAQLERVDRQPHGWTISPRNAAVLVGLALVIGWLSGGVAGHSWFPPPREYEHRVALPPYDGTEFTQHEMFAGHHYTLHRCQGALVDSMIGNKTVLRLWNLQTRLAEERFEIFGAFQIYNVQNPLLPDVTAAGGEINQIYLVAGEQLVLLYHGQQGPKPGTFGVFGRSVPLRDITSEPGVTVSLFLILTAGTTPDLGEFQIRTGIRKPPGAIEVAKLDYDMLHDATAPASTSSQPE